MDFIYQFFKFYYKKFIFNNQWTKISMQKIQHEKAMMNVMFGTMNGTNNDPIMQILEGQQKLQNLKLMTQIMKNQQHQEQELLKQHLTQMKNQNSSQTYQNQTSQNNINQQNVNVKVNVETLKCPLTRDFFGEAYTINSCGHNFEKKLIEQWLSSNNACPVCRKPANRNNLTKNYALQEIVNDYKNQN
ncbi:hypothetical protein pb186bvf_010246 [Paramecium bursaria]